MINAYLSFNGNAMEAFQFYRSVFGGEFQTLQYFKDLPAEYLDEKESHRILHVSLPVGKHSLLMGCDTSEHFGNKVNIGNNFTLSFTTESTEDADRIFLSLSRGGKVNRPMQNEFWGAYSGMLTDKFGINWMISFEPTA
ncbi:VOC family protein [Pollutibacter soli]|uniref:VOC family protein n=1 Tax=Pollutibacter soli TaxID=3034157 RepID=UPI0030138FE0